MAKTRLSNCAQLMRARVEAVGESLVSLDGVGAWSASPGTSGDGTMEYWKLVYVCRQNNLDTGHKNIRWCSGPWVVA